MEQDDDDEDNEKKNDTCTNLSGSPSKLAPSRNCRRFQVLESQGLIVGKTLGTGSYAVVKSAYDVNRKHKVAIKVISKRKAPNDYLKKFLPREIEVIKLLKHPSLTAFYQVIETTTRFFLVMELSENGDLLDAIRIRKYVSESQAALWFRQFLEGVGYMHARSISHRDLKCENLLLDSQNNLKVTDFGFAKKVGKGKNNDVTLSETYCGSYAYAPPEILRGIPYDAFAADVWSMGVVLFTMVYGRLPFDDLDHAKLLKQVQRQTVFPSKPEVSEQCRILILKILVKVQDRVPLSSIKYDAWYKNNCLPTALPESEDIKPECSKETSSSTSTADGILEKAEKSGLGKLGMFS